MADKEFDIYDAIEYLRFMGVPDSLIWRLKPQTEEQVKTLLEIWYHYGRD